jgi:hypothetical protein
VKKWRGYWRGAGMYGKWKRARKLREKEGQARTNFVCRGVGNSPSASVEDVFRFLTEIDLVGERDDQH